MNYQLITNQDALAFLDYYEDRVLKYGIAARYLPLASIWGFISGKLALDSSDYEYLQDDTYGHVLRFTYPVSDYVIVFTIWKYHFGKINHQPVCLAQNGNIQVKLSRTAQKDWHPWLFIDRFLLPVLFISMLITIGIFSWLLWQIGPGIKWYLRGLAIIVLALYGISTSRFCLKYWHSHKYVKLWLKLTTLVQ